MKVLVCGGRNYEEREKAFFILDAMHGKKAIALIIEGGARGADTLAREWAVSRNVPFRTFHANWALYGRRAGPIRNQQMLDEAKPDVVIAFPGGDGTRDMVTRARNRGIKVFELSP